MSSLALGTVQFGLDYGISNINGRISDSEIHEILKYSKSKNIEILDTAYSYGISEERIGQIIKKIFNSNFKIITKTPECLKSNIEEVFQDSLKRLMTDSVYGLLFHNFNDLSDDFTKWDVFLKFKKEGFIKKIGVSLYHPYEWTVLLENKIIPDLVQIPLNMFDQRFESSLPEMKERGVEIYVRSVFLQGLFFIDYNLISSHFFSVKDKLKEIKKISLELDMPISQLALNFIQNYSEVDFIVLGVDSLENLKENYCHYNDYNDHNDNKALFDRIKALRVDDEKIILPYFWPSRGDSK